MKLHQVKKQIVSIGMAAVMTVSSLLPAYGAAADNVDHIKDLKAAETAEQLILVVGDGTYKVTVSYYKKKAVQKKSGPGEIVDSESWTEVFTTPGVYGKNGAATEKKEGDGKTPIGTYGFSMAFGLKEDPGSVLPYHKIQKGDYWVDDSDSQYYNQLVNTNQTKKSWKSAEDMSASSPYYNYALALDYNKDRVPGAGSAIFIHCTSTANDTGSQGCIRIPEDLMKTLVQSADEKTKIIMVSDVSQLEYR